MNKLLFIAFMFYSLNTNAQMGVAKIKYEEAEEAYTSKNYKLCLEKLDGVVEILKETNPKVQYLRIICISKMIEKDPLGNFKQLVQLSEYYNKYLIDYDNIPDLEEKYKAVYLISEMYKKYAKNEEEYQEMVNIRKRGRIYKYDKDSLDFQRAEKYFNEAYNKGDFRSLVELAGMYESGGPGFPANNEIARKYYQILADNNIPEGLYKQGIFEIRNYQNNQKTYDNIANAANQGYLPAITLTGIIQFCGYQITKKRDYSYDKYKPAIAKYQQNTETNDLNLGAYQKSVKYWLTLAETNGESSSEFYYYLGKSYALGIMTGSVDFVKAAEYFKKSADLGNKKGKNALGFLYMNGYGGLEKNTNKAFELFTECANQVFAASEYHLYQLYSGVSGFPINKKQAQYWRDRYDVNPLKCIEEFIPNATYEIY